MASTHTGTRGPVPNTEGKAPDADDAAVKRVTSIAESAESAKTGKGEPKDLGPFPSAEENARKKREEQNDGKDARTFTYIGAGEDSPRVINFMGQQKFVRGEPTKVSDPKIIEKLLEHPTFVEGKADQETLHRIDEEAKAEADLQRANDKRVNAAYTKKHRTEG